MTNSQGHCEEECVFFVQSTVFLEKLIRREAALQLSTKKCNDSPFTG